MIDENDDEYLKGDPLTVVEGVAVVLAFVLVCVVVWIGVSSLSYVAAAFVG